MLSAVLHGKKLGTGFAGLRLQIGETQGAEDVLTASVFERIGYLPDDVFIRFMQYLFKDEFEISALRNITFWAGWQGRSVEPDVILECTDRTIIIEAKRYDNFQQQYAEQLAKEIKTAFDEGILNPILLTVGGMNDYSQKSFNSLKNEIDGILSKQIFNGTYDFFTVSWQDLYKALQLAIDETQSKGLERLLYDIKEAYSWHGIRYQPYQWLENLMSETIRFESIPKFATQTTAWKKIVPINLIYETFPTFIGE